MGKDGKLENPLLKNRPTLLAASTKGPTTSVRFSSLAKPSLSNHASLVSSTTTAKLSTLGITSASKPTLGVTKSNLDQPSSLLNKVTASPSLFNKSLGCDLLLKPTLLSRPTTLLGKEKSKLGGATSVKPCLQNLSLRTSGLLLSSKHSQLGNLSGNLTGGLPGLETSGKGFGIVKHKRKEKEHSQRKDHSQSKKSKSKESTKVLYETMESIDQHEYEFSISEALGTTEVDMNPRDFFKGEQDRFVEKEDESLIAKKEKEKIDSKKIDLINIVSVALLRSPNLEDGNDETRKELMKLVREMAGIDPEFVLKLALYTRTRLNIRVVANFMLAFASYLPETRPFLKKYYGKAINLPTDWVKVAEFYQTFFDKRMNEGSLPVALRNVMVSRFSEFNEYQLGKHNKDSNKGTGKSVSYVPASSDDEEEADGEVMRNVQTFSLKRLVRKLHISEPVYHIMCILGKKYPEDSQTFYQSRLPGMFDETKAGQRMKLATPETWETQVSAKGNVSKTWEDLLDHRKLPYMAMLRNIRNMLIAGISDKHHNTVLKRLQDTRQVINSKQFPFRFLAAYEVLDELEEAINNPYGPSTIQIPTKKKGGTMTIKSNVYSKTLLKRYKNALDNALKISTIHNISPISGTTVILINYDSANDNMPASTTKNVSSKRTVFEMALLLSLMCKFHCEDGILLILDAELDRFIEVENLNTDKILENISVLQEKMRNVVSEGQQDIKGYLNTFLTEPKQVNNFLMLNSRTPASFTDKFIEAYRRSVNPSCLRVSVLLTGSGKSALTGKHDVDVNGFSDQVLQYVAERGNGRQLITIEKIDVACGLEDIVVGVKTKPMFVPSTEKIERPVMPWKTIRVFISSTFKDMHGERDLLTRYVFPELRCWCYNYCLNVYEVDLRWGISEKQAQSSQQVGICLREVLNADLFIGIVGERYGWIPENHNVSWLENAKNTYSMTELEMRGFKHKEKENFNSKALFYIRDKSFMQGVPKDCVQDFAPESRANENKVSELKDWIYSTGATVSNYSCKWGGVVENKPVVKDLERFGQRVLSNLWNAIKINHLSAKALISDNENENMSTDKHYAFASEMGKNFVGRKKLVDQVLAKLDEVRNKTGNNLLLLTGRPGSGKTAFMSKVMMEYSESLNREVPCYFLDAVDGKKSLLGLLKQVLSSVNTLFQGGQTIPETYTELKLKVEELFKSIAKHLRGTQCIVFVESLDKIDPGVQSSITDWIPDILPKNVVLVVSCTENTACHKVLASHKQLIDTIKVGAMELSDRAEFVRKILANYGKALDESAFNNQMKLLLSKKDSASPLYLKLACEELRVFGVYEKFYQHIQNLATTVPQLIELCMQRLEMENGEHLLRDALTLLHFSRQGLTKEELFEMLNMLHNLRGVSMSTISSVGFNCFHTASYIKQEIPLAYFMKMCQAIKMFLSEELGTGVLKLVYNEVMKVVQKRYINAMGMDYMSQVHIVLAGFYKKQADPGNTLDWSSSDQKALTELPYHLTASAIAWKHLQNLLTDINFIKAKVEGNMCGQLLEDFQADAFSHSKLIQSERNKVLKDPNVVKMKEFISKNMHILSKYPLLLKQQALNTADKSFVHSAAQSSFSGEDLNNVIMWLNKSATKSSKCSLTITQQQPLHSVCLSHDETMIACGMEDGQLVLYDKNTTKELKTFIGHSSSITSCSFIGTNKICSASEDGSISIWDVQGGHRLCVMEKHTRQVSCCECTDDGKLLVSTSWDNTARLWNVSDGTPAGELTGYIHPFNCLALDKHQKHVALGGWNKNIVIWNIIENKKTDTYKGHHSSVRALAYAPSGLHLASASLAGEIMMWSTENGAKMGQLSAKSPPLTSLSFTPSGQQLIVASTNSRIKVWRGNVGAPGLVYKHGGDIEDYALSVAVGTECIVVGYNSGYVVLFSHEDGSQLEKWKAHSSSIRSISFISQDQKGSPRHLITASDDGTLKRWAPNPTKCLYTMEGHSAPVRCVRAKEAYIVSGSEDCSLHVWPGLMFEKNSEGVVKTSTVFRAHRGIVTCCDISPCETMALSGSSDKSFIIWSLTKNTALLTLQMAHKDGLTACSWSDVGNYIVTGANDFALKMWDTKFLIANQGDAEKMKEKANFKGHSGTINSVQYKYGCVVSSSTDGQVKVWTHKGVEITTFMPHEKRINSCDLFAASLEEQLLGSSWSDVLAEKSIQQKVKKVKKATMNDLLVFTASDDGTVSSYSPFKPCAMEEFYGHTAAVTDLLVSKLKPEVISCSTDKTIKTWEHRVDPEASPVEAAHMGEVSCLAAHHGSNIVVTGGLDGKVRIYSSGDRNESFSFVCSGEAVKGIGMIDSDVFVTGDSLGNVIVWNLEDRKPLTAVALESPIQSVEVGGEHPNYIAVSSLNQFQLFRFMHKKKMLVMIGESILPTYSDRGSSQNVYSKTQHQLEYPMPMMSFIDKSNVLIAAENYNHFQYIDVERCEQEGAKKGGRRIPKMEFQRCFIAKASEEDSAAACIVCAEGVVYIGNMNGTISFCEVDTSVDLRSQGGDAACVGDWDSVAVHDDSVTGVLVIGERDMMVTASRDCTLKVWHGVSNGKKMVQVGLYHCRAPVTVLRQVMFDRESNTLEVVLGDVNGNVEFLKMNTGL